ncbi:AIM24 family protein [Metabacillus sp. 113a]|uniref:AIM24 family protein n=1 Tax=Metabacillus sp. 113a TaxID=3404706 RepID=UPI003CEC36F2
MIVQNNQEVYSVIEQLETQNATFKIVEFNDLNGSTYLTSPTDMYYAKKLGMGLRQIAIELRNGSITTEAGALHYMLGSIEMDNSLGGAKGMMKKFASNVLTNESGVKPKYNGSGDIFLEPSFGHFLMLEIDSDSIIVDRGMFYCCESTVEVGIESMKNLSSAARGGEGLFQTKLTGSGIIVLSSPVPANAVVKVDLNNDTLKVDGNFAILRTGGIQFTVERSAKGIIGSATSGEGYLQTFRGTGQVWLSPTTSRGPLLG